MNAGPSIGGPDQMSRRPQARSARTALPDEPEESPGFTVIVESTRPDGDRVSTDHGSDGSAAFTGSSRMPGATVSTTAPLTTSVTGIVVKLATERRAELAEADGDAPLAQPARSDASNSIGRAVFTGKAYPRGGQPRSAHAGGISRERHLPWTGLLGAPIGRGDPRVSEHETCSEIAAQTPLAGPACGSGAGGDLVGASGVKPPRPTLLSRSGDFRSAWAIHVISDDVSLTS